MKTDDKFEKFLDALEDLGLIVQDFEKRIITGVTIVAKPFKDVEVTLEYTAKRED